MSQTAINQCLPNLEKDLLKEIYESSEIKDFSAQSYVVKQGQFVRFLPIVIKGSIKVFSIEEDNQFLLYHITSGETCIFSFAHIFNEKPIEFSAITEIQSELLLLPIDLATRWIKKYPSFSNLLLQNYQRHYEDLLHTTKQIMCYNLEDRLFSYLKNKTTIENSVTLSISHQHIADDLGTSREVISRLLKKMNLDKKVEQIGRKIKLL
ncbi:Crp/Fnr family transcriptional regulator [Pseudotenacibaculum haliotis]|uniref:Crp/Fnr family transcriptional regulator n=1 Tax=Pseudotenacibaculum haliotis TaxID=1862138 RepID=A0ABW5LPL8_9FLAO